MTSIGTTAADGKEETLIHTWTIINLLQPQKASGRAGYKKRTEFVSCQSPPGT